MTIDEYNKKRTACLTAMGGQGAVPESLCRLISSTITVWLRQGHEVASPKDSKRLRHGQYGWELPLGENRFGVALAVRWSRDYLANAFKFDELRAFKLTKHEIDMLEHFARCAVIGHGEKLFHQTYPLDANRKLWFGTHAVVLSNFSFSLAFFAGFRE